MEGKGTYKRSWEGKRERIKESWIGTPAPKRMPRGKRGKGKVRKREDAWPQGGAFDEALAGDDSKGEQTGFPRRRELYSEEEKDESLRVRNVWVEMNGNVELRVSWGDSVGVVQIKRGGPKKPARGGINKGDRKHLSASSREEERILSHSKQNCQDQRD